MLTRKAICLLIIRIHWTILYLTWRDYFNLTTISLRFICIWSTWFISCLPNFQAAPSLSSNQAWSFVWFMFQSRHTVNLVHQSNFTENLSRLNNSKVIRRHWIKMKRSGVKSNLNTNVTCLDVSWSSLTLHSQNRRKFRKVLQVWTK